MTTTPISQHDRDILRALATAWMTAADLPIQAERRREWRRHNDAKPGRPLVFCAANDAWREVWRIETRDPRWLGIEWVLRNGLHCTRLAADVPLPKSFQIGYRYRNADFGLPVPISGVQEGGASHWDPPLKIHDDLKRLVPGVEVDVEASERWRGELAEVFGDILPVGYGGAYTPAIDDLAIKLRGMDQLLLDMCDAPEFVHALMAFLRDQVVDTCTRMERLGQLGSPSADALWLCSDLPAPGFDGTHVRLADLPVSVSAQGFTGISPAMFRRFVFPCQQPIMELFGLSRYGCCEPLHQWLDTILSARNIRRVTVAPWTDLAISADRLRRKGGVVLMRKVHPNMVGTGTFDPQAIEAELRRVVRVCQGVPLEIHLIDQGTFNRQPDRLRQWCEIAHRVAVEAG